MGIFDTQNIAPGLREEFLPGVDGKVRLLVVAKARGIAPRVNLLISSKKDAARRDQYRLLNRLPYEKEEAPMQRFALTNLVPTPIPELGDPTRFFSIKGGYFTLLNPGVPPGGGLLIVDQPVPFVSAAVPLFFSGIVDPNNRYVPGVPELLNMQGDPFMQALTPIGADAEIIFVSWQNVAHAERAYHLIVDNTFYIENVDPEYDAEVDVTFDIL
jgi:hypothetical protein